MKEENASPIHFHKLNFARVTFSLCQLIMDSSSLVSKQLILRCGCRSSQRAKQRNLYSYEDQKTYDDIDCTVSSCADPSTYQNAARCASINWFLYKCQVANITGIVNEVLTTACSFKQVLDIKPELKLALLSTNGIS